MAAFIATSSLADESKGPRVPDAAEAEKQVLSLSRQWVAAEDKANILRLRSILDARFIATFGSGKTYTQEAYIKGVVGNGAVDAMASQTLTDETVVVDRDTAVVGQR
jgi:hypothetical protein